MPLDRGMAFLAACALSTTADTQETRWQAMVHRSLAELAEPSTYVAACERLERAGPRIVAFVRMQLRADHITVLEAEAQRRMQMRTTLRWPTMAPRR